MSSPDNEAGWHAAISDAGLPFKRWGSDDGRSAISFTLQPDGSMRVKITNDEVNPWPDRPAWVDLPPEVAADAARILLHLNGELDRG